MAKRKREDNGSVARLAKCLNIDREENLRTLLYYDAKATRMACRDWGHATFIKSPGGQTLPKEAKIQIEQLVTRKLPASTKLDSLHADIGRVIQCWEAIPPTVGSREYRKAKIRLLADMLWSGEYADWKGSGEELPFTAEDLAWARRWLFLRLDGEVGRYNSLRQVWRCKDLTWDSANRELRFLLARSFPRSVPRPEGLLVKGDNLDVPDHVFEQLLDGTYESKKHLKTRLWNVRWTWRDFLGLMTANLLGMGSAKALVLYGMQTERLTCTTV